MYSIRRARHVIFFTVILSFYYSDRVLRLSGRLHLLHGAALSDQIWKTWSQSQVRSYIEMAAGEGGGGREWGGSTGRSSKIRISKRHSFVVGDSLLVQHVHTCIQYLQNHIHVFVHMHVIVQFLNILKKNFPVK